MQQSWSTSIHFRMMKLNCALVQAMHGNASLKGNLVLMHHHHHHHHHAFKKKLQKR
jgi:hypothetical protein